ncbi:MAG: serine/threonine protein kinase, partial [Actinomycetota bacterium]|nr:serine/threonine protein kinase [Actinomycetota bacterium]
MLDRGTTLAGYRIDAVLGQGGMGTVYQATQLSLDRVVALKLLAPHLSDDVAFRERFRREGQIQARLEHPHIVTVFEAGETEHGLFIAMRLVRGRTLKDMIVARELDAGRTLRILEPVADALDEAHDTGLIHRDIKPQNMLVGGRDHTFLADFGLTKAASERSLTKSGYFLGTLDYVSPEQVKGERATPASDIYSLAGVLYECLTGVVPYPKESEAALLYAHVMDPPPRLTDHRPELPHELDEVLERAMAKEPSERHPSALALIDEVGRSFTRRTRAALKPPGPIDAPAETGIREAEAHVPTRESDRPTPDPALWPETVV